MNGLGGLNKSPGDVVVGLVQLQNPTVATRDEIVQRLERPAALRSRRVPSA